MKGGIITTDPTYMEMIIKEYYIQFYAYKFDNMKRKIFLKDKLPKIHAKRK